MTRVLCLAFLFASCFGPVCAVPCDRGFDISLSILYLEPTFDDTAFVIVPEDPDAIFALNNAENVSHDFDFHPGLKASITHDFFSGDCRKIGVYYTGMCNHDTKTVSGDPIRPVLLAPSDNAIGSIWISGYEGFAKSNLKFCYNRIDVLYTQGVYHCGCVNIDLNFGFEWDKILYKEHTTYEVFNFRFNVPGPVALVHERTKLCGIGPELGLDFDYLICRLPKVCNSALSFVTGASASLLVCNVSTSLHNDYDTDDIIEVEEEDICRVVPALHFKVGFKAESTLWCRDASLEIGYQLDSYIRGRSRLLILDDFYPGSSITNYYNYNLQGFYATFAIGF